MNFGTSTAKYRHTKEPVQVQKNDKIIYTIRVYNEGYIDGIVKEITDYLPEGLELVPVEESEINREYGWQVEPGNSQIVKCKKEVSINNGHGNWGILRQSLKYHDNSEDFEIECRVSETNKKNGQPLVNVAEITNYGYMNGDTYIKAEDEGKDVDSEQKNVFSDNDLNNLENAIDRHYKERLLMKVKPETDTVYYPGKQDDDDFECVETQPFDLALRKFISEVDGVPLTKSREPVINEKSIKQLNTAGTAYYYHVKDPVTVQNGKTVTYTIRVFNEGSIRGYAKEITDILPEGLVLDENGENTKKYQWVVAETKDGQTYVKTTALENEIIPEVSQNNIPYKDVKIDCKVQSTNDKMLANVAEITKYGYETSSGFIEADKEYVDRDSKQLNVFTKRIDTTNIDQYIIYESLGDIHHIEGDTQLYQGIEDDDDFEAIIAEEITGSYSINLIKTDKNNKPLKDVEFTATVKKGNNDAKLTDTNGNEIKIDKLVTDSEGKISISNINITEVGEYVIEFTETKVPEGYVMLESPIKVTYKTKMSNGQYSLESNPTISGDASVTANSNSITIRVQNGQFDLALRKFITAVRKSDKSKEEITSRIPVFKIDENGKYIYEHTKEPVTLGNQNVVEYTLRVYNEGQIDGYAKEIKDDIPDGLEFLPNDDINKEYNWKMINEEGNAVENVNEAKYIVTDYLSKEKETEAGTNLLKAFDLNAYKAGTIKEPNYKEVKVAFKVTIPNSDNRIIINQAQISDDSDKDGNDITDKDSTPDKWIEGEDDQDIEKVKVLEFDLALRKWVTKAIVIEKGKQTVTETGHKAEDDPEDIVKLDFKKSAIKNLVVKYEYKIRVTNEGEIAGYAKEISDYIPEGLRFEAADNPLWEEVEGKVVTDQLKDTLLQPGESAEVSIILTWINREDNMGLKVNVAEISKDYNEYGTPDRDSTPNNKVPGEDDIDDAPVMLTVKTGQTVFFIGTALIALNILCAGVVLIKKNI